MNKALKQNIKKFVIDNLMDIEGYSEYEFELIQTHPEFDKVKWNEWNDGYQLYPISKSYDKTAQKMIKWAHKQIEKEVKTILG